VSLVDIGRLLVAWLAISLILAVFFIRSQGSDI